MDINKAILKAISEKNERYLKIFTRVQELRKKDNESISDRAFNFHLQRLSSDGYLKKDKRGYHDITYTIDSDRTINLNFDFRIEKLILLVLKIPGNSFKIKKNEIKYPKSIPYSPKI